MAILAVALILIIPAMMISLYVYPKLGYVLIPYYIWVYLDRNTPATTGRICRWKWIKKAPILPSVKNYFSSKLIKTAKLPPGQNYLIVGYPHALTPFNTVLNFLCNVDNITDEVFPEIEFWGLFHNAIYWTPLLRELVLALGTVSCDEACMKRLLTSTPSKGALIYPGGGSEMYLSAPGPIYRIIASRRKGFIRVALMTGAPLVPLFTFGDINLYKMWSIQNPLKRKSLLSFWNGFFIYSGRGIFQNHWGLLPRQRPLTTVVGKPIDVPKIENPSMEIIDEYHKKFFDALFELFEEYKHIYDEAGADAQLIML